MTQASRALTARIKAAIRDVADFPKPGIRFKDITPLLADAALMREVIAFMGQPFISSGITHVVGIESRGFLFGVPIALALNAAFVPARKPGKLPWNSVRETFALEYGDDALEVHADAVGAGASVLVVDDILATGGTARAACRLIERLGATVVGVTVLGTIGGLGSEQALVGRLVHSVIRY